MVKTRRKTRQTTADGESQDQHETGSQVAAEETGPMLANLHIPEDIDFDALQSLLPDTSLTSPTPEAVISLYRFVLAQVSEVEAVQRELEEARADSERKDVELDQALQDRETAVKELDAALEASQNELKHVKEERDRLATSNNELQAHIATLSSSQSSSSTEVVVLKQRVEDTEREKRDLVGVVSRLKEDSATREEEIQTLRTNLKQARQDYQGLEAQIRDVRSTETSAKFKIDSLTQQLQLAKEEFERTSAELTTKTEEFGNYRRTKHAELAHLQAQHDSLTQTHASTESTLKALQSAHSAQTHQLTQALARVQDLTGRLAEQDAAYSSEAAGLRRLISMMEDREAQAKKIVEGIEQEWATVGDRAERRENVLREAVEKERRRAEDAEQRVEQLEKVMDKMDRGELPMPTRTPGTPVRNRTGDLATDGMMGLSPTVAMVSKAQRSGKTFTEVYADYVKLQDEYAKKSAEYDYMDKTLASVLAQIEERAPILAQQRLEYERLQSESAQLASQLGQALVDRDSHASAAQDTSQKLARTTRENEVLQKQLEDLGRQVQRLLKEIARREDTTIPPDEALEQDEGMIPAENIGEVITNNLVLFRSIGGLQEQNQKLLKIVRELGAKMEAEERDYRVAMEKEQLEAVREAHEAIQDLEAKLESQKKSSEVTIQAYMKERDALRSMLGRVERGLSVSNGHADGVSQQHMGGDQDVAQELADVQRQFEAYKMEMGVDSVRLREDAVAAQREAGQMAAALAKANAKIEYLTDRHHMAQEQYTIQNRELETLAERHRKLYDQYTRADIECNRVSEDLRAANGHIEKLRNECANLRAEKKIWDSVQFRLVEENKSLSVERSQLSDLMSNVQKMHNDLEQAGQNDRRRLENQVQMMESQTQDLRTQLTRERETVRHLSLQKDIEVKEFQARLDKAIQDLSKTREALIGAETSKKHLEDRLEELTRQSKGDEEKLAVYERRSTAVNGVGQRPDENMSREQQLEAEVAELRSALKITEVDLANARSHVQQFQEISQANETALTTLNSTHDEYKTSTEFQVAKLESDCNNLRERLQSAQEELSQSTQRLQELQQAFESERAAWNSDKKTLEETIIDITTSEKNSESDRTSRESEVREQEQRAKAAEEKYSHEVIAHADTIKNVEELKKQLANAQGSIRDSLAAAETATAKLSTSEESWRQQKEALDKEVVDLNARCRDLTAQNGILHQHLESVSTQAARIRHAASDTSTTPASGDGDAGDDSDAKLSELRSVVAYLRKEKEIVDLQLELSKQENLRMRTQIEHLVQQLENTRAALSEERERAVEAATSEAQHAELVERINQLTILRESNTTLRADCEAQTKRANELDVRLKRLSAELDPIKEEARSARAELEARDSQIKRLEEESRRWQERNAQLLTKYDRIDPAEMQSLKDEIEQLKSERAQLQQMNAERDEQTTKKIEELETQIRTARETGVKNNQTYRQRFGQWKDEKTRMEATVEELRGQIKVITEERDTLQSQSLSAPASDADKGLSNQLDVLRSEKDTLENALAETKQEAAQIDLFRSQLAEQATLIATLRDERDTLLAQIESLSSISVDAGAPPSSDEARLEWENERADLIKARDAAKSESEAANEQASKALEENKSIRASNEKFQARIQDLQKARVTEGQRASAQQEVAVAAAVEKAKSEMPVASTLASDDTAARHADELRTLEERLRSQFQDELRLAVEAAKQVTGGSALEAERNAAVAAAIAAHEESHRDQHAQEIAAAVERGRQEQAMKSKIKDSQLVRAQNRLKELEAQILEWKKAGYIPEQPASAPSPAATSAARPTTTTVTASSSAPAITTALSASQPPNSVSTASTSSISPTTAASPLPRKPSMTLPTGPADTNGRGRALVRGAARGVGRGGLNIRGAAPGRGGAPASATPVTAPAGGVSIMGAAGKRNREDGEEAADDSLAKRLKPADGTSKPPVKLRRDGVSPST